MCCGHCIAVVLAKATLRRHHQSGYFRAYFATLETSADSSSSKPSSNTPTQHCNHPSVAQCIHLPQQTKLVRGEVIDALGIQQFLCYLYFSSHYCHPPIPPLTEIDLDVAHPPLSQTFPHHSIVWSDQSVRDYVAVKKDFVPSELLLALAHYFDCAEMMQQCGAVLAWVLEWAKSTGNNDNWLSSICWSWLPVCDRYHLCAAKKALVGGVAAQKGLLEKEEFKKARQSWDKALVMEVIEAALAHRDAAPE